MAALFKPHERGDVKVVENTIIDNSKNVKNENLGQVTEYSSEAALVTNVDLGKGSHTQVDQIDPPAGIDNVVDFIRGQEFDHDFKMEKTETGSTITGQIEGTSFTINVGVTSDKLIFDSSISGGDSDKGFVIKVGGISITFAAGGRDSDSPVQTRAVIPYSMDKEGNVDIDASYYLQATKNDQNTDTNEKKQTSGNR